MMDELIEKFDLLSINEKRNQISSELMIINAMIAKIYDVNSIKLINKAKNYDIIDDSNLPESDMLTFYYEDIYNIEQALITILSLLNKK